LKRKKRVTGKNANADPGNGGPDGCKGGRGRAHTGTWGLQLVGGSGLTAQGGAMVWAAPAQSVNRILVPIRGGVRAPPTEEFRRGGGGRKTRL